MGYYLFAMDTPSGNRIVRAYLSRLAETGARGDWREESFYPSFGELLLRSGRLLRHQVDVTSIPRKREACLLDFQVWNGGRIAGYVEAKAPGTDLTAAAGSAQLLRYRQTFPNLLLTDFREVRLFRDGALEAQAEIAAQGWPELRLVLDRFFAFGGAAGPASAAWLAAALAARARVLAACVLDRLEEERESGETTRIGKLLAAFREHLRAKLSERDYADLYAQTLAYGLLAARLRETGRFDRSTVLPNIPRGSGILHDVFEVLSADELPAAMRWIVDDLVDLLAAAPIQKILDHHFDVHRKDPVQHFYETFLKAYDADLRKSRGVYYTPRAVVSFMVRAVHSLLRSRFGLPDGLADPGVTLLDPAAGTLTFLTEAFAEALDAYKEAHGPGGLPALVRDHLLPHFLAFELMMAPYAIGHWKARLFFQACGLPLADDQRVRLYLTNALETDNVKQTVLPFGEALADEAYEAQRVKKETRVSVVIGNPPWSGHSANDSPDIDVAAYAQVDGEPLGERNPKWLQDDYVKFIRLGQMKIEQNGAGILCVVTPHGYLDSPTFRGLRRSLLETFDELYFVDLHGNQRKRERCPDGGPDDNVFDGVMQGVAIAILVKKPGTPRRVLHTGVVGNRGRKEQWLDHDFARVPWTETQPRSPAFLVRSTDPKLEDQYARGWPLTKIFPFHSVGVLTARDEITIGFDREDLEERVHRLRAVLRRDESGWKKGDGDWRLGAARRERVRRFLADGGWRDQVRPILYHPFDRRVILYDPSLVDRPRREGMKPLLGGDNLGLVVPRQAREGPGAFVTDRLIGHKAVSAYDINSVFPLYPASGKLFQEPNLSPALLAALAEAYGEAPVPEAVFFYVYAVLHSPRYCDEYAPFLRAGFPRVPFPMDVDLFSRLGELGAKLVDLHLLRAEELHGSPVRCSGDGRLGRRPVYDRTACCIRTGEQGLSFEGIELEVWTHRIGGYQVLERWLAARAGRRLSLQEIEDFPHAAAAIGRTLEIQPRLDELWRQMETFISAPAAARAGRSRGLPARRAGDSAPEAPCAPAGRSSPRSCAGRG